MSTFAIENLEAMINDLQSDRIKLAKLTVSDSEVPGLRAVVRKEGRISFFAAYTIGDSRPMLHIGDAPKTTIDDARALTRFVRKCAEAGIDVREELEQPLLDKLRKDAGLA